MTLDVVVRLAAASASAAAGVSMVVSGHARWNYAAFALTLVSAAGQAWAAFGPWDMVSATIHEAVMAWLVVVAGIEIGQRAFRPLGRPERRRAEHIAPRAALGLAAVGAVGAVFITAVQAGALMGYRGLAVVECMALAFVSLVRLGIGAYARTLDRFGLAALLWLSAYSAIQAVYLVSWEAWGLALAAPVRALVATAQVYVFLSLAAAALGSPAPVPVPSAA